MSRTASLHCCYCGSFSSLRNISFRRSYFWQKHYSESPSLFSFYLGRNVSTSAKARNYYEVLGVTPTASAKEIKTAYYSLSKQFHPDLNQGKDTTHKFKEVSEAYETLGNAINRRDYDRRMSIENSASGPRRPTVRDTGVPRDGGRWSTDHLRNSEFKTQRKPGGGTFTGKTKYYDFDEFYRQHYHEMKQQQVRAEQIKAWQRMGFYDPGGGAASPGSTFSQRARTGAAKEMNDGFILLVFLVSALIFFRTISMPDYSEIERIRREKERDSYYSTREQIRRFHGLDLGPTGVYKNLAPTSDLKARKPSDGTDDEKPS